MKDPGTADAPGTDLQRIQIVKGWVDGDGTTHERVFDVAGDASNGAGVDPATCAPHGAGARELCTLWRDPGFKRQERAFYYARVLENPTCRWSTRICKAAGVDPLSADCAAQAATANPAFANCCLGTGNDPFMEPLVQERAWTSPIWYRPEGIAAVRAKVRYGAQPGADRLAMQLALGGVPAELDPGKTDIDLRVRDDDDIVTLHIPAGTLVRKGRRKFVLAQALGSVATANLVLGKHAAALKVVTAPTDLSTADREEHSVTVSLSAGTYRASHTRFWALRDGRLVTR
jgi:hypothetical protein